MSEDESKLVKIENQKARMLSQLEESDFRTLIARVAFILNHYPETRDSDRKLSLKYWETFQNGLYNSGNITGLAFMKLEQQSDITRARAKIQNDFGSFQASDKIQHRRREREEVYRDSHVELSEDASSTTYVYCDESGKSETYALMGGLWISKIGSEVRSAVTKFKENNGLDKKYEFHFSAINKDKAQAYLDLIDLIADFSANIGFKALCTKRVGSTLKIDDIFTKLYTVGICDGLDHEIGTGRAGLPVTVNVIKDQEDGKDKLVMASQTLELETHIKSRFDDKVRLGTFQSVPSNISPMVQIADVFTGCLSRLLNFPGQNGVKDQVAHYFFDKFKINKETFETPDYDFFDIQILE